MIVEIAASSAAYDLGDKLNAYRRNGVQEYIVWQVHDRRIDWFRWKEGAYVKLEPDREGILKSEVFPGLWLGVKPLLEGNLKAVLAILQSGLKTVTSYHNLSPPVKQNHPKKSKNFTKS